LEKTPGSVKLIISIKEENEHIQLDVWNTSSPDIDYASYQEDDEIGLGLLNIQKRLQMLFPLKQTYLKLQQEEHGTNVQTLWPKLLIENRYNFQKES
jgi:LytS/YehU family sensor histidine kinase